MSIFDSHQWLGGSLIPGVANNADSLISVMKDRGIDRALVFSCHALRVDPLAGNRVLRKVIDQDAALFGCLITHTNRVESSVAVMREQMAHPKIVGMAISNSEDKLPIDKLVADEIMNAYRRYGKPLFLFTPNAECVHGALAIAQSYSMFKVVFIGMGGEDWRVAIAAAKTSTNILLDTSGSLDRAKIPAAVEALGTNRLLFASGAPHLDAAAAIGLLEDSGTSEEAKRRILSINAARLFGLDQELPILAEPTIGATPPTP